MAERGSPRICGIEGADEFITEVPARPSPEAKSRDRESRSKQSDRDRSNRSKPRRSRSRDRERERDRHTSRDRSPSNERGGANLGDRLIAMSKEQGGEKPKNRGEWLEKEHKRLLEEKGVESDSEPTEELITKQVMLPTKEMVDKQEFKEPITKWVTVEEPSDFAKWSREGLPEEEVVRPPDWRPPTPPRVDISLLSYIDPSNGPGEDEERRAKRKKAEKVYQNKEEVLNDRDLRDDKEIVVYDAACVIRTTKEALREQKRKAEQESRDFDRRGGRGGGFGGPELR